MVKARPAVEADIPAMLALGRMMHAESPRFNWMSYSDAKVERLIREMITGTLTVDAPGGALVVEKGGMIVGMIGGTIIAPFFSDDRIAMDYAFYIVPEHRRRGRAAVALLTAFEQWARDQGAIDIWFAVNTMIDAERTVLFFEKFGYRQEGFNLSKRITA